MIFWAIGLGTLPLRFAATSAGPSVSIRGRIKGREVILSRGHGWKWEYEAMADVDRIEETT